MMELYPIDANEADYLYIKPSQIPNAGLGLFTAIKLQKGDIIATFHGEVLKEQEAQRRQAENKHDYFMNLPNGLTLDCQNTQGFAKMANDGTNTTFTCNAIITLYENQVVLVARKTILIHEEIFTSYGKQYWNARKVQFS